MVAAALTFVCPHIQTPRQAGPCLLDSLSFSFFGGRTLSQKPQRLGKPGTSRLGRGKRSPVCGKQGEGRPGWWSGGGWGCGCWCKVKTLLTGVCKHVRFHLHLSLMGGNIPRVRVQGPGLRARGHQAGTGFLTLHGAAGSYSVRSVFQKAPRRQPRKCVLGSQPVVMIRVRAEAAMGLTGRRVVGDKRATSLLLVSCLLCCLFLLLSSSSSSQGAPLTQSWALSPHLAPRTSYVISSCPVVSNTFYMSVIPKEVTPSRDSPLNSGLVPLLSPHGGHEPLSGIASKSSFPCSPPPHPPEPLCTQRLSPSQLFPIPLSVVSANPVASSLYLGLCYSGPVYPFFSL